MTFFSNFLNQSFEFSAQPLSIEQTLPIAMEDFSQDPNFKIYSQDSKVFPETLAQLAHVHYQKKLFINNQNEFLFEGKAGMDGVGVLDTPSTSTGNSFSFLAELFQQLCSLNGGEIFDEISQILSSFGIY